MFKILLNIMVFCVWVSVGYTQKYKDLSIADPNLLFISKSDFVEKIQELEYYDCPKINLWIPEYGTSDQVLRYLGYNSIKFYCNILVSDQSQYDRKMITLKNYFLKLEQEKFYNDLPRPLDDIQVAYEIGVYLPSLLFTYSLIKSEFSVDEINRLDNMFYNIVKRYQYVWGPETSPNDKTDNKALFFNNYTLMTSILLNDKKMFNNSINKFFSIMRTNSSDTGFLKVDGRRGECALNYNFHALYPILSTIWNLKLQGFDISQVPLTHNHNIDQIVNEIINSTLDPKLIKKFQSQYGVRNQAAQTSCYKWMNEQELARYYDKENDLAIVPNPSKWIYVYGAISQYSEENIYLFNQSDILQELLHTNDDEDNNAIGVFSEIIYGWKESK